MTAMDSVADALRKTVSDLFSVNIEPKIYVPEEKFGDFASNVAMQIASSQNKNPRDVAQEIADQLQSLGDYEKITIDGPGFINITVSDQSILESIKTEYEPLFAGKKIVTEYSDPNPFKVLHAGHLYTSIVGDVISSLFELNGADVSRVNFGGDVGLHVAKAMWGITNSLGGEDLKALSEVEQSQRPDWLSQRYVEGNTAYEEGSEKDVIVEINKRVYKVIDDDDHESTFAQIYWTCRQWSYDYFDAFYEEIGTPFEKYYPESETAPTGLAVVNRELENGVYEQSEGAIIFNGEKYDLHKRVFINSEGLPTYEAKDVGLAMLKWQEYSFDKNVIITGSDIQEYMKVVLKSIEQFQPEISERTIHVTHGMVKLKGGVKMSSRLGNFLKASDILDATRKATDSQDESAVLAAVKYSFLKQSVGPDVIFNIDESVAIQGSSGPYLQYAHARARSILAKSKKQPIESFDDVTLEPEEKRLASQVAGFNRAIQKATEELAPHIVCLYLYETSQEFNKFYENNKVIDDGREELRLFLVSEYADVLKRGLNLLGIKAPDSV